MTSVELWSFRDTEYDHVVEELPTVDALTLVRGIAPGRIRFWKVKAPGKDQWQPLSKFSQKLGLPSVDSKKASPSSSRGLKEITFESGADQTVELQKTQRDRRKIARHPRKIEFLTQSKSGQTFQTLTEDLSMEGAKLKKAIPTWLGSPFIAYLYRGSQKVRVVCVQVGQSPSQRIHFESVDPVEVLRDWVLK